PTTAPLASERVLNFYQREVHEQLYAQLSHNLRAIICQRLVPGARGGRCCAVELLSNTPRVMDLISKGDIGSIKQVLNTDTDAGILSFDRSMYRLAKLGMINEEEALQAAVSSNDLKLKLQ